MLDFAELGSTKRYKIARAKKMRYVFRFVFPPTGFPQFRQITAVTAEARFEQPPREFRVDELTELAFAAHGGDEKQITEMGFHASFTF